MNIPAATPAQSSTEAHLRRRWLLIARAGWLAIAAFCLVV
jgi:hypothetical protein